MNKSKYRRDNIGNSGFVRKPVEYTNIEAMRYMSLYRLCIMAEKRNKVLVYRSLLLMKMNMNLGLVNSPYIAQRVQQSRLDTRYLEKDKVLILACFQYLAYKNFLRMKLAMDKLVQNRKGIRMLSMMKTWNKMKMIGARRIYNIMNINKNIKMKKQVVNKWRAYSKYLEIDMISK